MSGRNALGVRRTVTVSCLLATVFSLTVAAGFNLNPIPSRPVGDSAWNVSSYCERSDGPRIRRFIDTTKRLISASRTGHTRRAVVAPSIWATYQPWRSGYVLTFDFAHPGDLAWIANCLQVAGADQEEARRLGLHIRPDRRGTDLEYTPDVGFYFIVVIRQ